jgi:hypothetical protein
MAALSAVVGLLLLSAPASEHPADSLLTVVETVGHFSGARRLTLSPQGWILVADAEADEVVVLTSRSAQPKTFGGFGWGTLALDHPTGIATDGLNIYVADEGNHRIQRYDRTLSLVASLVKRDTTIEQARFGYPRGVGLSRHGDLFVLDGENTRVVVFTGGDFKFLRSFGDLEGGRSMLSEPLEVDLTPDDRVIVLESGRLIEFDYFGNYVRSIGEGVLQGARGFGVTETALFVVSKDRLWSFTRQGALRWSVDRSALGPQAVSPFSDVAPAGDGLYVLTEKDILLLAMSGQ